MYCFHVSGYALNATDLQQKGHYLYFCASYSSKCKSFVTFYILHLLKHVKTSGISEMHKNLRHLGCLFSTLYPTRITFHHSQNTNHKIQLPNYTFSFSKVMKNIIPSQNIYFKFVQYMHGNLHTSIIQQYRVSLQDYQIL